VFSKSLAVKWRALVLALIVIILGQEWLSRQAEKKPPVILDLYAFIDMGANVFVKGTWIGDSDSSLPLQVTKLDCWEHRQQCIEATVSVRNGLLTVETSYWEVENWSQDELTFKDNDFSLCANERLRFDRKNQVVTYVNAPKQPLSDACLKLLRCQLYTISRMSRSVNFGNVRSV
jgi:hypothetical protein